ncbi:NRDE protein-domain-containing protein [Aspergillus karnatakaensis]|uniref:NRDE family protein n=1 Tax=Aspergillus karnatakaensis TaxID=1810916 RepID=UPI003CCC9E68
MCIAILTTTHPAYRYIIINNRDEFLSRPTAPATWWTPSPSPSSSSPPTHLPVPSIKIPHILSARDLARPAHGTWLGVTKEGRVAVLTNCLEKSCARAVGLRSRGGIIKGWLTAERTTATAFSEAAGEGEERSAVKDFIEELRADKDLGSVGGFNLLFGDLSESQDDGLVIISNRATDSECCSGDSVVVRKIEDGTVGNGQTVAVSNMTLAEEFDEGEKWKKISLGEELMAKAVQESLQASENENALVERLFDVLATDTLPRLPADASAEAYLGLFEESIFVPAVGKKVHHENHDQADWNATLLDPSYMEGLYGTQTQTVILIGYDGRVRFIARTLYDEEGRPLEKEKSDRSFEFMVER